MYPRGELNRLLARKAALRQCIAIRRLECRINALVATQPLRWLDRTMLLYRRLQPLLQLAAVPLGLWLMRSLRSRVRGLGPLLRWGPPVLNALRSFTRQAA